MLTNLTNIHPFATFPVASGRSRPMAKSVNIYDAKTHLSELVDRAAGGEEIVIAKAGVPAARLVPLRAVPGSREPGRWAGRLTIARDFDAPLPPAVLAAFEGDAE